MPIPWLAVAEMRAARECLVKPGATGLGWDLVLLGAGGVGKRRLDSLSYHVGKGRGY